MFRLFLQIMLKEQDEPEEAAAEAEGGEQQRAEPAPSEQPSNNRAAEKYFD